MLGRLRMSVTDVIKDYGTLADRVFSDAKLVGGDAKFKASKLEEVIKEIVEEKTGRADELMMDTRPEGEVCKTYAVPDGVFRRKADRPSALCVRCPRWMWRPASHISFALTMCTNIEPLIARYGRLLVLHLPPQCSSNISKSESQLNPTSMVAWVETTPLPKFSRRPNSYFLVNELPASLASELGKLEPLPSQSVVGFKCCPSSGLYEGLPQTANGVRKRSHSTFEASPTSISASMWSKGCRALGQRSGKG
jgi:hypothetical protein